MSEAGLHEKYANNPKQYQEDNNDTIQPLISLTKTKKHYAAHNVLH